MSLRVASLTVLLAVTLIGLAAQGAWAQGAGPQVGDMAPDFSLPGASKAGVMAKPLHLSDFRGQVAVISFFPKARTKGWTVQHEAYRDQYATIFNDGKGVVAISISSDGIDELAAWAKEANFPVLFASDTSGAIAEKYATTGTGIGPLKKFYKRVVFVVGPDGRVAHVMRPFSALSQDSYVQLDSVIDRVVKTGK